MTIKFRCPSCGKVLGVKEGLAGRKAPCPGCKAVLTIPAASAPPGNGASAQPARAAQAATKPVPPGKAPVATGVKPPPGTSSPTAPPPAPVNGDTPADIGDAETFAASLLGDEPPPEEPVETKTVTFNCPQCDDPMTVSAELAGKQAPCPSCRRIVKVPLPQKKEPIDWRQPNKNLPSGARQNFEAGESLVGATTTGDVSLKALEEAGAVPEVKEKLTRVQFWGRVAGAVAALLVIGFGAWTAYDFVSGNAQHRAVRDAENAAAAAAKSGGKTGLRKEAIAEIHRAAGEWYLRSDRRDAYPQALRAFRDARALLGGSSRANSDADALLVELAFSELLLVGHPDEPPEDPRDRSDKDNPRTRLRDVLGAITSHETKAFAGREVCRRLVERGHTGPARVVMLDLPGTSDEWRIEAHGVTGMELLARDPVGAEKLLKRGLDRAAPVPAGSKRQQVTQAIVALCVRMQKPELLQGLPEAKGGEKSADSDVKQGFAVGLALQGDRQEGLNRLKGLSTSMKVPAMMETAAALPSAEAKPFIEAAMDVAENELKGRIPSGTLARLAFSGVRCGLTERAGKIAAVVNDPGLRGWAQLQVLRASLDAMPAAVPDAKADEVEKQSVCWLLARVEVARHNARFNAKGTRAAALAGEEALRPFGLVGYALGVQDSEQGGRSFP